jgi:TonB-dependent receptor
MTMTRVRMVVVLLMAAVSWPAAASAQGRETGAVAGTVVDATRGAPLPGALVRVDGTSLQTATDRTGAFRLTGVQVGPQTIFVSFLGRQQAKQPVTVAAGATASVSLELEADVSYSETVTVTSELAQDADARALNQQRTALSIANIVSADQIGSFPDPNAAEAASRIPGVSIARDQGEGRYVLIRGTEARLNSMLIDGERIPSAEGDLRQVMLDAVPADQLQSIEVSKALTPDMDADAIGGAVNLITRQAVGRPTLLFSAAGGYNALQRDYGQSQFTGTLGRRFAGGRLGLLVGFSATSLTRGSENFEVEYADGSLGDLQLRDYQIQRERYGVNVSADARVSNTSTLSIKTILNEFKDYEVNNRIRFRPPNRRIEHVLKNRHQNDHIRSVSGGGTQLIKGSAMLDYKLAWAYADEDQPDRLDTIFRQTNVNFAPNVSPANIDPDNIQPNPSSNNASIARLNAWETEIFNTSDRDVTGSFNLRMPIGSSGTRATFLKVGAKVRDKAKRRDFEIEIGTPAGAILFPQLEDAAYDNSRFMNFFPAGYAPFPGINAAASRALFTALPASSVTRDFEGDAQSYTASERVLAAYAMAELFLGPKLTIVPGVRFESTKVDYVGNEVLFDDGGDYASTRPVTGGDTYGFALPGLHLRYAVNDRLNVRAAYTRTLARPNYFDLVPYQIVFQEDGDISRGNSSLRPTTSDNLDLMVEHYFASVGVVSGGVFYKRLHDYIFPFRFQEQNFGELYAVTQPQNGESANLSGVELAFQNRLKFLPGALNGISVYGNYTFTTSSARFPDRSSDSRLPGQSQHLGNLAVSYEKSGFTGKAALNFHGRYIDAVGESAAGDVFYDNHTQLDLNFSQRLARNIRVYADVLNLRNAPLRYYIGTTDRPIQQEYYRWWTSFGVKVNW